MVRRDHSDEAAHSVNAEFISGNYFRTFGLQPRVGRLLMDADDTQGATPTAVMSFQTWQHEFAGDPSVVGSTFLVNTKPVTVVGVAPQGFFGDRLMSTPPDFYLPIGTMNALANAPYVNDPESDWLYIIGRVKPGVQTAALQVKLSQMLRQIFATHQIFSAGPGKDSLPKVHIVLTPGGDGMAWAERK